MSSGVVYSESRYIFKKYFKGKTSIIIIESNTFKMLFVLNHASFEL